MPRLRTDKPDWQLVREYENSQLKGDQRFGQWVYNVYGDGRPWPELFYADGFGNALYVINKQHTREELG